jgi:hypothetical protein
MSELTLPEYDVLNIRVTFYCPINLGKYGSRYKSKHALTFHRVEPNPNYDTIVWINEKLQLVEFVTIGLSLEPELRQLHPLEISGIDKDYYIETHKVRLRLFNRNGVEFNFEHAGDRWDSV